MVHIVKMCIVFGNFVLAVNVVSNKCVPDSFAMKRALIWPTLSKRQHFFFAGWIFYHYGADKWVNPLPTWSERRECKNALHSPIFGISAKLDDRNGQYLQLKCAQNTESVTERNRRRSFNETIYERNFRNFNFIKIAIDSLYENAI